MTFWIIVISFALILSAAAIVFIVAHIHRFPFIGKISEKNKALSWVVSFALILPIGLFSLINVTTMMVVLVHLAAGFAISDFLFFLVRKISKKEVGPVVRNMVAFILTMVYLAFGWVMANHVFVTKYSLSTDKELGSNLRIVQIADSHIGITLDGKDFSNQMERVSSFKPDIVVITGDFVDDETRYDDMIEACKALGSIDTKYGVFFVFGNHDKGYYNSRDFSTEQLRQALSDNGVVILEDECVLIDDRFYIIGRQDKSVRNRADISVLVSGIDGLKYSIVLDHQPNDYDNEAAANVDLVLSGHTHGGHLFPLKWVGLLSGANDWEYGTKVLGNTTFVVTSGISGWAIPFKTGCYSEFVVIDIN